jgi:hypothetical protein
MKTSFGRLASWFRSNGVRGNWPRVNIYLDTNIWDALFDGEVQPEQFIPCLARANKRLVLGLHAFYESARIFQSPRSNAFTRGKKLFEFLSRYLDAKILCAKDQSELLPAEMLMLKEGPERVEFFYPRADYEKIVTECRRLASGMQSELARQFLLDQQNFAISATKNIIDHMKANSVATGLPTVSVNQAGSLPPRA